MREYHQAMPKEAISEKTWILGRTHVAPYRGYGYVPLRFGGNVIRRMGTQQERLGYILMLALIETLDWLNCVANLRHYEFATSASSD